MGIVGLESCRSDISASKAAAEEDMAVVVQSPVDERLHDQLRNLGNSMTA